MQVAADWLTSQLLSVSVAVAKYVMNWFCFREWTSFCGFSEHTEYVCSLLLIHGYLTLFWALVSLEDSILFSGMAGFGECGNSFHFDRSQHYAGKQKMMGASMQPSQASENVPPKTK